ncbi:hypothetical protein DSL72_003608 [Monilinia vaccinii-corymbosi]|uniref:Uncharacterized protein n=1 Tax=Monilinia vaccinii-corymbosi TaxID=61207 RepID=A0A8A3P671_9HELO|nr:hypothetical protein DSL72_003608 [Monilinia vaccinii-corymbosi]
MESYSEFFKTRPIAIAVGTVLASYLALFFKKLYHARMLAINLKRKGFPLAPNHNFFFGHLLYLKTLSDKLPPGAHYQYMFGDVAREHFLDGSAFYLDLWPMSGLFLTIISPTAAITVTQTNPGLSMERPHLLDRFFIPIAGGANLFDLGENEWKPWRAIFVKGFSSEHILSLVLGIVKEIMVYKETLKDLARKGAMFQLDTTTLRFTMDLTGRKILNVELGAQRGYNVLADCMLSQIRWHQPGEEVNPFGFFNIARRYMHWSNSRQMNRYLGQELDRKYEEYKENLGAPRSRSVIDLVLQAYLSEDATAKPDKLDAAFRAFAILQIRLFVFVGHDSTSSTICYCMHLLSQNPKVLTQLRAEHDSVLGTDLDKVPSTLAGNPQLSNSLLYTTAVIKEVLRLFAPAGSSRQGKPGECIVDDLGNVCPADQAMVWMVHVEMHRAPKYVMGSPRRILPQRWLVDSSHELYPMRGAWRPVEHGPRNCMAQALVMTELRVILACLVREFDFKAAYDELDRINPRKGIMTYRGERADQIEEGAAHPVDHYPCRVFLRDGSKL